MLQRSIDQTNRPILTIAEATFLLASASPTKKVRLVQVAKVNVTDGKNIRQRGRAGGEGQG
jgi:hypothetical protein